MSDAIDAITRINSQLAALKKIQKSGSYMGAGITLGLTVGAHSPDVIHDIEGIQLGISGEPEALVNLLIESLTASRAYWVSSGRRELATLQEFMENQK